jgi:FkbM family methyltransferase
MGLAGIAGGASITGLASTAVERFLPKHQPWPGHRTYAQSGEDVLMAYLCERFSISKPSYLDIGCWAPIEQNNTYLFYRLGGRGVLIEPNPAFADLIRKERPEDKFLGVGIGIDDATEADYYMFNQSPLNTFDPEQVERLKVSDPNVILEKTIKVPLVNINRVIAEHFGGKTPDIVSIDIEGLDLAVMKTLDYSKYRPKILCVETLIVKTTKHNPETTTFLASQGYELRGMTYPNTIYMDSKLLT